jgi:hypothetical protein
MSTYTSFGMLVIAPDSEKNNDHYNDNIALNNSLREEDVFQIYKPSQLGYTNTRTEVRTKNYSKDCLSNSQPVIPLHPPPEEKRLAKSFEEMVTESPEDRDCLLVVLDGANIGYAFGNGVFIGRGLEIAIKYFTELGIQVRAFLPAHIVKSKPRDGTRGNGNMETEDSEIIQQLVSEALLTVVPAGDNDDEYIIEYAREHNGFVVSNDFFADHVRSMEIRSIKQSIYHWIADNRCGFTFVGDEFMPNPGSRLALAVSNRRAMSLLTLNAPSAISCWGAEESEAAQRESLELLTNALERLFQLGRKTELKYVLLARIHLFLEVY